MSVNQEDVLDLEGKGMQLDLFCMITKTFFRVVTSNKGKQISKTVLDSLGPFELVVRMSVDRY